MIVFFFWSWLFIYLALVLVHSAPTNHRNKCGGLKTNTNKISIGTGNRIVKRHPSFINFKQKYIPAITRSVVHSKTQGRHPYFDYSNSNINNINNNNSVIQSLSLPSLSTRHHHHPKRKAILIGINYFGQDYELKGCIYDVYLIKRLLESPPFNFTDFYILTDDGEDDDDVHDNSGPHGINDDAVNGGKNNNNIKKKTQPTGDNIRAAIHWLVRDAHQGDSLFLHYSGHGSRMTLRTEEYVVDMAGHTSLVTIATPTDDPNEPADDTIVPIDWAQNGEIMDNELYELIVPPMANTGARLTVLFDCCHSGSGLDLVHNYTVSDNNGGIKRLARHQHPKVLRADVVLLSACQDQQSAADSMDNYLRSYGAMTKAVVQTLREAGNDITFGQLLIEIQKKILEDDPDNVDQRPQLSSELEMDLNSKFSIVGVDGISRSIVL